MVKETKPNKVYEDLKDMILTFKLKPGEAIGEVDIAQKFGVSRTPVRDAFKRLEADGLIEVKSHIGTYVTLIDVNQISDAIFIREHIEKAVISELCQNYKISLNMRINYILRAQEKLLENEMDPVDLAQKFLEADNEFHRTLFEAAGRESVWEYIESLQYHYNRLRMFVNRADRDKLRKVYEQHCQIVSAIERQDEEGAKVIYARHLYEQMLLGADVVIEGHAYFKGLKR